MPEKTYAAFIRGINVGGKTLKMDHLKDICRELGLSGIQTYIQSGNVVFKTEEPDAALLSAKLKTVVESRCGFPVEVITKSRNALLRVIQQNPLLNHADFEAAKMYVTLLSAQPSRSNFEKLLQYNNPDETYELVEDVLYIIYRNGYGNSKFSNNYIEKQLSISATTRNWNTIQKVYEMTAAV